MNDNHCNQRVLVLRYLRKNRSITQKEAFEKLGITDLAGVMRDLREEGKNVIGVWTTGTNRFGKTCRFKKYSVL